MDDEKKANSLYVLNTSWCEGAVFDELYQEGRGVSGVLTFQLANEKNLEVFEIDNVADLEELKSQGVFEYICRDERGIILYHDLYQEAYRVIKEYLKQGKQVKLVSKQGTETPKLQIDDYDGIAFIVEDVNLGVRAAVVCGGINQAKLGKGAVCSVALLKQVGWISSFLALAGIVAYNYIGQKKIEQAMIDEALEKLKQTWIGKTLSKEIDDYSRRISFKRIKEIGYFDPNINKILINSKLKRAGWGIVIPGLAHELKHAQQYRKNWPYGDEGKYDLHDEVEVWMVMAEVERQPGVRNQIEKKLLELREELTETHPDYLWIRDIVVKGRRKFTNLYESCVADMKITEEEYESLLDFLRKIEEYKNLPTW